MAVGNIVQLQLFFVLQKNINLNKTLCNNKVYTELDRDLILYII